MAYHQQVAMLQQAGRSIKPKDAFIEDLLEWMLAGYKKGKSFILGGDFNEILHIKSNSINFCAKDKLQLVDILDCSARNNQSSSLPGKKIICYMLVSPNLVPAIRNSGYNKFDQVKSTDHCGMYVDFDTEVLFGNGDIKLANERMRTISSKDPLM
eukprot:6981228-Ditylum_brightwellii.AAC.1